MGGGTTIKRKRAGIDTRRRAPAKTRQRDSVTARPREAITPLAPSAETTTLRAWAEVDLAAIARNIRAVHRLLSRSCRLMAVVKADAYGHGVVPVCRAALAADAAWLGVATLGEGVALRLGEISAPVLVLGGLTAGEVADATAHGLSISITSQEMAEIVLRHVGAVPPVHLKVDTGMTRLGVFPEDVPVLLDRLTAKGIPVEGCYTQLACADEPDHVMTQEQLLRFRPALEAIRARVPRALIHVANSAGALTSPHTHFDMVRVGLAMYGLYPAPQMASLGSLHPAMRLYSRVVRTARVGPGTAVSYGAAHRTKTSTTIATIACGYADGYPRLAGERGEVLIRGQRHRIAGRVCMDHLMVDVGDHPVAAGDVAQLFGDAISADEVAAWAQTISYEILCGVGLRVPRIYVHNGVS
ncbi:MAG: alanine racemase [Bacillati bacterium ANGP1]|uniref:Alanine racemase n=1 Tax=Candidatus Segetimicrobium genomatis TaxID=2569760 RepID=A0A537KYE2_9BACT|nr:MAG: alanine racemase [Terrabacteria group bacterium ANGP1]